MSYREDQWIQIAEHLTESWKQNPVGFVGPGGLNMVYPYKAKWRDTHGQLQIWYKEPHETDSEARSMYLPQAKQELEGFLAHLDKQMQRFHLAKSMAAIEVKPDPIIQPSSNPLFGSW